jgi:hypothetical protein
VLADEHHPPPPLNDVTERPQIPVDLALSSAWLSSCSKRTLVGVVAAACTLHIEQYCGAVQPD